MKNLLAKYFYKDTATVKRASNTGWGNKDYEIIYADMPCALHQYGKELSAHRNDTSQKITIDLRLCCSSEYNILENDVLEVVHQNQVFCLVAGTAFKYPTHTELSLRRRKESQQP